MTSLEPLDQSLPEANRVSAPFSQYPLIKSHRRTPFIHASVVSIPQMSHHQGKLPDLGYKPTPKVLQLKNNPSHTIGLREQQFPKRMLGKHNNSYHRSLHTSRRRAWERAHGAATQWRRHLFLLSETKKTGN
uniref:Uncharacterized protein n=1 Tax=Pipistrellus kuhlii TaxID=59472 RepID=A0A7J7Y967_PIPKU|nr:hypothetical protein mPipKuh1_010335 [Pipistrellus kuhlii]